MSEEKVETQEVFKLDDDDFKNEEDYLSLRPLNLHMPTTQDDDGIFEISYFNKKKQVFIECSGVNEDILEDGEIADIADVMFPIMYNIEHTRQVVPVEANLFIGYSGIQKKSNEPLFYFPLFWNGTINVGDRGVVELYGRMVSNKPELEKIDTDIDLTEPIGFFVIELDNEDVDIDDYTLEDKENLVRQFANDDDYTLQFYRGKDVSKEIDDKFLKPQEETINEGVVQIATESYKAELKADLKKLVAEYKIVKEKMDYDSATKFLTSFDAFTEKHRDSLIDNFVAEIDKQRETYEFLLRQLEQIKKIQPPKAKKEKVKVKKAVVEGTIARPPETKVEEKRPTIARPPVEEPKVEEKRPATPVAEPISFVRQEVRRINRLDELRNDLIQAELDLQEVFRRYKENPTPENLELGKRKKGIIQFIKRQIALEQEKEGKGINNPDLYEKAKKLADETYKKPSAYKSGFIVKKYKELGGTYSDDKQPKKLKRWFKEEWKDIGNKEYPVYRPTKRITKDTPLTATEIDPKQAKKQIALKQEIKGDANLPPFQEKVGTGKVVALGVQAEKIPKQDEIWKWSNPVKVAEKARKYLGDMAVVFRSTKPKKKYMIFDPVNNKWIFFGEMNFEDFTKHQDPKRRENYLTRTASMKGNWKNNRYSANNLSRNILW